MAPRRSSPSSIPADASSTSDPVLAALANARLEDEPISEEEERAVAEAREALRRGKVVSQDELRGLLGI
jgi:hypothetical protein